MRWPRLFDRLHLTELVLFSLWAVFILVIMGLSDQLLMLMDFWMNRGIPFFIVIRILFFRLPALLQSFLPVSALFAAVIVAVRWVRDQDMIVFESAGVSLRRLMFPVVIFGLILTGIQFYVQEYIAPHSQTAAETLFSEVLVKDPAPLIEAGRLIKDPQGRTFYASGYDRVHGYFKDIIIVDPTRTPMMFMMAKTGRFIRGSFRLDFVNIYSPSGHGWLHFEATIKQLSLPFGGDYIRGSGTGGNIAHVPTSREMTLPGLSKAIHELEKVGLNSAGLRVDRELRYSLPFSNLVLSWLGVLIVVKLIHGKRGWGRWVLMGGFVALVCLIYLFLIALMRSLGIAGVLPPIVAAWTPLIILVGVGGLISLLFPR